MKPRRHLLSRRLLRRHAISFGVCTLATTMVVHGGDLLRGGAAGRTPATTTGTTNTPVPITPHATGNANDSLSRTSQAIQAVQNMQTAARNLAQNGPNNLGPNPTKPNQLLPDVPDGLADGGLVVDPRVNTNPALWQGANLPVQTAASGGKTQVTVKQTAQQALLNWQTFNVGKNTELKFDQSAGGTNTSQWIAFNKVNDPLANPTQILGTISAPGQVYIINRNGIIFGGSSQVNTHTLVASALPINDVLVQRGLLNNADHQFLFDALDKGASDDIEPTTKFGDVTVQAGAKITTPVSADGNGGRIMLVGANVNNAGTLSSASGQTILAAGLQVGIAAHDANDASLRGLDVYVGAVNDPASSMNAYAGTVTNNGIISISRGSTILTGKSVNQRGVIDSTTSVSLNGRIDLLANYNAVANTGYDPANATTGTPFLYQSSGSVTLGSGSITRILPELSSTETVTGTELALRSQINVQGLTVHLETDSTLLAPNAIANLKAGNWLYNGSTTPPSSIFLANGGQIYLDQGAEINLAGSTGVTASVAQNVITLQLRGSELSVAPVQRDGELRGDTITVDLGVSGTYEGRDWIGTPLADLTGYAGLVQRTVGQLTTAGGTLNLSAGASVVVQNGALIDVSGGSTTYQGANIQTTRLIDSYGRLVNIAEALPGQVYKGVYTGGSTVVHSKWGVVETFKSPLAPTGAYYREGYTQGADGGGLTISAPSMALDGTLTGTTVIGSGQIRNSATTSSLPRGAQLTLNFQSQVYLNNAVVTNYPTSPDITFQSGAEQAAPSAFATDANGNPSALATDRVANVFLSPDLLSASNFGSLTVINPGGNIRIPEGVVLNAGPKGSLNLAGSNIDVLGSIIAPGGSLTFTTYNISPFAVATLASGVADPLPNVGRGVFTLGANAKLSTAGVITDDRVAGASSPIVASGGSIGITGYSINLTEGSSIDVSGGYVMKASGKGRYGDAGSIALRAGQDPGLKSVLGGGLHLGATLSGYSGAKAGSLSITAPMMQVGGTALTSGSLVFQPDFFSQGGFGSFSLTGIGSLTNQGAGAAPEMFIAEGTLISPRAKGFQVNPGSPGNLSLSIVENVEGVRPPVSLAFSAPGVEAREGGRLLAGDVVISEGAVIRTDAGATVSVTGTTVTMLGSIYTAGGNVVIGGSSNSTGLFGDDSQALVTTFIGAGSVISTAGTTLYTPDPYGRRIGKMLDGGSIKLTGNISASVGSVLDVSGTSAILDLDVNTVTSSPEVAVGTPGGLTTVATRVDSNGGTITLQGGQMLLSHATLHADAGGTTALGGTLSVSSDRYYQPGALPAVGDVNLIVTQQTTNVSNPGVGGSISLPGRGYFGVDSFIAGGFDSLSLNGTVQFQGDVTIHARGELTVANSGIVFANGAVSLNAAHLTIGQPFRAPSLPDAKTPVFGANGYAPTHGSGSLSISAGLIDIGNLSLQSIGSASFTAANGDIRGNGTLNIAGDLTLKAGQIYPPTGTDFTIVAYDHGAQKGSVTVQSSGSRRLPLSAGGNLAIYASVIHQNGVLRAPFGTITLGWDGTGTAPKDLLAGGALALPVTDQLTLGTGSITSVSAVDPITGKGITIPYGISPDGSKWIDPHGVDITAGGLPVKNVVLSAGNLTTESGANVDLRGGGDLYAYRWVQGLGGPLDVLAATTSFAVILDYEANYAPYAEYNDSSAATNLIDGIEGYSNGSLKAGDRVYLAASKTLPAGYYTLLPARYALLPGGVLVTPTSGGIGTIENADKSSVVSGYRFNDLNTARTLSTVSTRFEVASSSVVRSRARYDDFLANDFLKSSAASLNLPTPVLPRDSGHLVFQATQTMSLLGTVSSNSVSGGSGSIIDISTALDTFISGSSGNGPTGSITLSSTVLNGFGADSLLIGGRRDSTGTVIESNSANLTVDNAGSALTAKDIILVADGSLTIAAGSEIRSTGTSSSVGTVQLTGDGTLLRVSAGTGAGIQRTGTTSSSTPLLSIGANVSLSGGSLIIDSSARTLLDPTAELIASSYTLGSGRISLQFDNPGALLPDSELVLSNNALQDFQGASSLKLLSYSSIDLYGSGQIGGSGLAQLELSAGSIRGFNQGSNAAVIEAGTLVLGNIPNATRATATASSGTLELRANTIRMSSGQLAIDQYSDVVLTGTRGVIGEGSGGLSTSGNLTLKTPRLTGTAGAVRTLTSGGALSILTTSGATGPLVAGGLGSTLTLTGASIAANTAIQLPSGSLSLHATSGDLTIGGNLDVSGTRQDFYDVTKFTSGGEVHLTSDTGNVTINPQGVVDVSAPAGGGNAGALSISTPHGSFSSTGVLRGKGGIGGHNGTFLLDTASLASLSSLSSLLSQASFSAGQSIRVRNGDVIIDGTAKAAEFLLSADRGNVTVTGTINASGTTGGSIRIAANGNVILEDGSLLTVAGQSFSASGKGGDISLEAGSSYNGVAGTGSVDIRSGSTLDLSVASKVAGDASVVGTSAYKGQFSGTLHLRAPRIAGGTDLSVNAINGNIVNASSILVEGYKIYDLADYGGIANGALGAISADGKSFLGAAGSTTAGYTTIFNRLTANNAGIGANLVLAPGVELINSLTPSNVTSALNAANSTLVVANTGGSVLFPNGTGSSQIRVSAVATITSTDGTVTTLGANAVTTLTAGSTLTLASGGTVTYANGTGAVAVSLVSGSSYTTGSSNSVATVNTRGTVVTLNTAGSSRLNLTAGTKITFPTGTKAGATTVVGSTNKVTSSVAGTITSSSGVVTTLVANVATAIDPGSYVTLSTTGTLTFASGGTGGPITVALASGSFTTTGATTITPPTRDIQLGTPNSTTADDWNLAASEFRFGAKSAPGVLTIRSGGNLVFNTALSDGFAPTLASTDTSWLWTARLSNQSSLLPINTQSWSYRLVAGADSAAADYGQVVALSNLGSNSGNLVLGRASTNSAATGSNSATTASVIANRFQVIRTGSGDIDIRTGRSIQLLNQFAAIYTAGTRVADATLGGTFDLPNISQTTSTALGIAQQGYSVQYSMAGGDVNLDAQLNIERLTRNASNQLVADSQFQMPDNWLYRRGYIDPATGEYGVGRFNDTSTTTWWVDFSNFFQGVGSLGGGDVTLKAGKDISNVDAVVVTNARMPKGTPDASRLVELGGGDLMVRAGEDIDGGVYYIERGHGTLSAGGNIHTNATRSVLTQNLASGASDYTQLPTTLFLGKGGFDISARGDVLLGPVANPFLLPGGFNNSYWNKSYFSTYAADSFVNVSSLGGSVTLRESATVTSGDTQGIATPLLQAWYANKLLLSTASASYSKPWLRLNETSVQSFTTVSSLLPGTLRAVSFSSDINLVGHLILSPSATGTVELLAAQSINGLQPNGLVAPSGVVKTPWGVATINLSDADPSAIPGIATPHAYQAIVGIASSGTSSTTDNTLGFLDFVDQLFSESGATLGANSLLQTKQALHAAGLLHLNDTTPTRLYAGEGDISGLTLYSPKVTRVMAGQDIADVALYLQNVRAGDVSLVTSGRDILPYSSGSVLRVAANSTGNTVNDGSGPLAGDIQISGPGTLEVVAGRNLDLGIGAGNIDGTGTGITSVGNTRNPYLSFEGADLVLGAGVGSGHADYSGFITKYIEGPDGVDHLKDIGLTPAQFDALSTEEQHLAALRVFYSILRKAGRDHNDPEKPGYGSYDAGKDAIATLFPGTSWDGDILTRGRDIRTTNGGDISIYVPGGGLAMADTLIGNPLSPPGIVTASGGSISLFANNDVNIGIGRIFTLRGGDEILWSSKGNIAAGSSSKTVKSAPPTRVLIDPQSGAVKTDLAGLATGGGIGVLATVKGVEPGNVDLIAPEGFVDAGDAGIRAAGNLNISAAQVLNAGNISVGGTSGGTPAISVPSVNLGGIAAANTANASTSAAPQTSQSEAPPVASEDLPSIITVEVLGYGGEDDEDDDREKASDS